VLRGDTFVDAVTKKPLTVPRGSDAAASSPTAICPQIVTTLSGYVSMR
jgi:hypothetical protein